MVGISAFSWKATESEHPKPSGCSTATRTKQSCRLTWIFSYVLLKHLQAYKFELASSCIYFGLHILLYIVDIPDIQKLRWPFDLSGLSTLGIQAHGLSALYIVIAYLLFFRLEEPGASGKPR